MKIPEELIDHLEHEINMGNVDKKVQNIIMLIEEQNTKYKEVIEKATKYIKSYKTDYSPYELSDYNVRQILEILKGDSNE